MTDLRKVFNKKSVLKANTEVLRYADRLRNGAPFRRNEELADSLDALALCSAAIAFVYGTSDYNSLLTKKLGEVFPVFLAEQHNNFSNYYNEISKSLHSELLSVRPLSPGQYHVEMDMQALVSNMDDIIRRFLNEISEQISSASLYEDEDLFQERNSSEREEYNDDSTTPSEEKFRFCSLDGEQLSMLFYAFSKNLFIRPEKNDIFSKDVINGWCYLYFKPSYWEKLLRDMGQAQSQGKFHDSNVEDEWDNLYAEIGSACSWNELPTDAKDYYSQAHMFWIK